MPATPSIGSLYAVSSTRVPTPMNDPVNRQSVAPECPRVSVHRSGGCESARVSRFLFQPRTRWILSWIVAVASAVFVAEEAWRCNDDKLRRDGNGGHASIDFGGQWLMARTFVVGQGRHLYRRNHLRPIARASYPPGSERPDAELSDAESLMTWLTGTDDEQAPNAVASFALPLAGSSALSEAVLLASGKTMWTEERLGHVTAPRIGGALYPPVHALLYAPLGLLPPRVAYRVMQGFVLSMVFFAGWVAQRLTERRVWMPVAAVFVMMFPGFAGCVGLGQNGSISMTIVLLGWWQLTRGREVSAGICWGLLAYKPVWALAFLLVPLLLGRWRMAVSMAGMGLTLIVLTLPFVGWEAWRDWLQVGQAAAQEYRRQENWIILSRDLLCLPRRWLLAFEDQVAKDLVWRRDSVSSVTADPLDAPWDHPLLSLLGWGLWTAVLSTTLVVVWRRWPRRGERTELFPSFALMGGFFSCYHFLYYDFVVAAVPVLLLFSRPRRYLPPLRGLWRTTAARWKRSDGSSRWAYFRNAFPPLLLFLIIVVPAVSCIRDKTFHFPPFDTFGLLALWAWCGYQLMSKNLRQTAKFAHLGPDVGSARERLADQHGTDSGLA